MESGEADCHLYWACNWAWICGPVMSLIDTAVIGQGSSTELAALGTENLNVDECSNFVHYLDHHLINMQLWS